MNSIGSLAFINQNSPLNSQMQSSTLNQANLQAQINIENFQDKTQETKELESLNLVEALKEDEGGKSQAGNKKERPSEDEINNKKEHGKINNNEDEYSSYI